MLMFTLSLVFLVTGDHVLSGLPQPHDDPGSSHTLIAIEVPFGTDLEYVFLRGGFSDGDNSRCSGAAGASDLSSDPCSLPILAHVQPPVSNTNYTLYSTNDRYLDFYGEELNQGKANGVAAQGTPTTPLNATTALSLLNTNDSGVDYARRIPNTFWFVELDLDCSKSNGRFEVEVAVPEDSDSRARGDDTPFLQRSTAGGVPRRFPTRINFPKNFDFSRLPSLRSPGASFDNMGIFPDMEGHKPNRSDVPEPIDWVKDAFNRSAAPRAMGWRANMDTASGRDARPFPITPVRVTARDVPRPHRRPLMRDQRVSACRGSAGFTPPYFPATSADGLRQRHMGLCGHANIFRYGTDARYCEVNTNR